MPINDSGIQRDPSECESLLSFSYLSVSLTLDKDLPRIPTLIFQVPCRKIMQR